MGCKGSKDAVAAVAVPEDPKNTAETTPERSPEEEAKEAAEDAEAARNSEYTNIWSAAYYGELPVVRHLLREEPSLLNMKQPGPGPLGSEPLIKAAQCGSNAAASLAIVELLLSKKADITVTTGSGSTALHFAADCGHGEVVKRLIAAGVSVNVKDEAGDTPLQWAKSKGRTEAAKILQDAGAQ
mmetsp:Transcript_15106/g.25697  ORF Transcript_15106/g.25697 Transcript_15106/m.25697 type:complete len:184 (-) Transcript_15106:117-668(-)